MNLIILFKCINCKCQLMISYLNEILDNAIKNNLIYLYNKHFTYNYTLLLIIFPLLKILS